ncbi:MAG: glycosyltransferase family 2 protein [Pseudorhodobacter sp.]|nr:glycosyltransferase family 2 protein [Pseudorhodobacter sp.]
MPLISVIVPAYRPRDFDRLCQSITANAGIEADWIVVDDGSGPAFDAAFAALPKPVRVLRQAENRRQGAARNAGLALASGAWIKFLDADDRLDDGHLAALINATRHGDDRAIPYARTRHMFASGASSVNDSGRDLPPEPEAQFLRQLVRPFLHHCGALFPRDLLVEIGGCDETLMTDEDGDLLLRILRAGYHFVPVEGIHYLYFHHGGGARVSADDDIRKLEARIRTCDKVTASFGAGMPPEVARALAQRMDKIAMAYWTAFPTEARALMDRAQALCPGFTPDMRAPLRLLRRIGGPGLVFATTGLYRRLRGRPRGGVQG